MSQLKQYKPSAQLQANEKKAEQAQPPMKTPAAVGNHNQYTRYMLDNGRSR